MATPTHCDLDYILIQLRILRRTRRGHADSLRRRAGDDAEIAVLGAHGVATPTHCDVEARRDGGILKAAHTAWPRQLIATIKREKLTTSSASAHTAWPRQLIATR